MKSMKTMALIAALAAVPACTVCGKVTASRDYVDEKVANATNSVMDEIDRKVASATPADYETVSNRAMNAVSSVNSKTGAVTLVASDVNALPDTGKAVILPSHRENASLEIGGYCEDIGEGYGRLYVHSTYDLAGRAEIGGTLISGNTNVDGSMSPEAGSITLNSVMHTKGGKVPAKISITDGPTISAGETEGPSRIKVPRTKYKLKTFGGQIVVEHKDLSFTGKNDVVIGNISSDVDAAVLIGGGVNRFSEYGEKPAGGINVNGNARVGGVVKVGGASNLRNSGITIHGGGVLSAGDAEDNGAEITIDGLKVAESISFLKDNAVMQVNGKTGDVTITAADVGALPVNKGGTWSFGVRTTETNMGETADLKIEAGSLIIGNDIGNNPGTISVAGFNSYDRFYVKETGPYYGSCEINGSKILLKSAGAGYSSYASMIEMPSVHIDSANLDFYSDILLNEVSVWNSLSNLNSHVAITNGNVVFTSADGGRVTLEDHYDEDSSTYYPARLTVGSQGQNVTISSRYAQISDITDVKLTVGSDEQGVVITDGGTTDSVNPMPQILVNGTDIVPLAKNSWQRNKNGSFVVGNVDIPPGMYAFANGSIVSATNIYSHAEGYGSSAFGIYSHAEGVCTEASGGYSHAEGAWTEASGDYSHAEGYCTTASGPCSHSDGVYSLASNVHSYVWSGFDQRASVYGSHGNSTYNINPNGGISGFYIGDSSLSQILSNGVSRISSPDGRRAIDAYGNVIDTTGYPGDFSVSNLTTLPFIPDVYTNASENTWLANRVTSANAPIEKFIFNDGVWQFESDDGTRAFVSRPGASIDDDEITTYTTMDTNKVALILTRIGRASADTTVDKVAFESSKISTFTNDAGYVTSDSLKSAISATDQTFSNAVLAVGLNIDTNSVAVLNEIASAFGGFPIGGTATTVGGILAALAAAIAWLKLNKADKADVDAIAEKVGNANARLEEVA